MRLTFLVNHDLASILALSYLLPELAEHSITTFYTDKSNKTKNTPRKLQELVEFEHALLRQLSWNTLTNAEKLNQINEGEGFERYSLSRPDLVISIRHMSILKPATIAKANYGIVNLHSGLLPEYRGVMATFWALQNKAQNLGTTLHFIDDLGIDTGRIIAQSSTLAHFDQSYLWNVLNLYKDGCAEIVKAVNKLSKTGSLSAHVQTGQENYFTFPTHSVLESFAQPLFKQSDTLSQFID